MSTRCTSTTMRRSRAGRELWGFPKKLAFPELRVEKDTLGGVLRYGPVPVAVATMGYKHRALPHEPILASMSTPNFSSRALGRKQGVPNTCQTTL